MILQCKLCTKPTVPRWVECLPEHHPRMSIINSVSQQISMSICVELRENKHSLIPKFPDYVFQPYVMKWIELFTMECPLWDMGFVTMCKSVEEIHDGQPPSYPGQCYRCICPMSKKLKPWLDKSGLTNFFEHCGVPPCRHGIFANPNTFIDHIVMKSKSCIFHFIIGRVIKGLYESVN